MRKFVRHPSSIPIELSALRDAVSEPTHLSNISTGGLACRVAHPLAEGSSVVLRMPCIWPDYSGTGVVAWCHEVPDGFEVGIQFGGQDAFKTRMVEQLCQIEQYRQQVLADQGRAIDVEQAAQEWIGQHAEDFAAAFSPPQEPH